MCKSPFAFAIEKQTSSLDSCCIPLVDSSRASSVDSLRQYLLPGVWEWLACKLTNVVCPVRPEDLSVARVVIHSYSLVTSAGGLVMVVSLGRTNLMNGLDSTTNRTHKGPASYHDLIALCVISFIHPIRIRTAWSWIIVEFGFDNLEFRNCERRSRKFFMFHVLHFRRRNSNR
jgi:hypothetical protein